MDYRVENKPLSWFRFNPKNYRQHPPAQIEALRQSLRQFGVLKNVVALDDGTLLAGEGTIRAAREEGLKTFPVVIFEGDGREAAAFLVADNNLPALAHDDSDQLEALLAEIGAAGMLAVTGVVAEDVEGLLDEIAAEAEVATLEVPIISKDLSNTDRRPIRGFRGSAGKSLVVWGREGTTFMEDETIERATAALRALFPAADVPTSIKQLVEAMADERLSLS